MTHHYIPNLSWKSKNIIYLLLYCVFKHNINTKYFSQKTGIKVAKLIKNRVRRIKNNQFNIKWFFNRYLKFYYQTKSSHLSNIESRLDIILFRTNWFINKEAARIAIKNGLIKVNNKSIQGYNFINGQIYLKPGDIVKFDYSKYRGDINKLLLISAYKYDSISNHKNSVSVLDSWALNNRYNIIPNIPYLEINNNTKTFMVMKYPKFTEIPYPFNLRKFK
jgi:ribosomal protein S4